jgi:ABC-type methionine transport system ATPase subunit
MEILTANREQYIVQELLQTDQNAYAQELIHYVTTTDGKEIFLTGYRASRLVYAVKTSVSTYKRETKKITEFINNSVEANILYKPIQNLSEDYLLDRRALLYKGTNLSLLIEHDLRLTRNRIHFAEQNFNWKTVEEHVNQYSIAIEENSRHIAYWRDSLEMLNHCSFVLLSDNKYILSIYNTYLQCLYR